jgi:nuclear transport factor 2 (NTF2) superfamily protein
MQRREAGINDVRIAESDRRFAQSEVALCQDT